MGFVVGSVVGGSVVGESVVGGPVVGGSVVGESVVGESVVGESVVGESVVSGPVVGGPVVGGSVVGRSVVGRSVVGRSVEKYLHLSRQSYSLAWPPAPLPGSTGTIICTRCLQLIIYLPHPQPLFYLPISIYTIFLNAEQRIKAINVEHNTY